jgi:aldose sugar dehydrogenase
MKQRLRGLYNTLRGYITQLMIRGNLRMFGVLVIMLSVSQVHVIFETAKISALSASSIKLPLVHDNSLRVEVISSELEFPTGMAFFGPNDILVTEKNTGNVKRIINGEMVPEPLVHLQVLTNSERGLLGMAISNYTENQSENRDGSKATVFLYFTEKDNDIVYNRVYRYQLITNELVDPELILNLPGEPGGRHNGGVILIGPDKNLYTVIGDVNSGEDRARNIDTYKIDGLAGIFRVKQDGREVERILGDSYPLNLYYAYGIRNSFGMDFDPVTGNLWDTENGDLNEDEINLVEPGFNSGFSQVQGMVDKKFNVDNLEDFGGNGNYSDPEFVWNSTVGPTALKFLNSNKLGEQYENDMFVGDFNNGYLYHFDLNKNRTEFMLDGLLKDRIADNQSELENIVFAEGFGGITDIEVGPDGYLYVLALGQTNPQAPIKCATEIPSPECRKYNEPIRGALFRIVPVELRANGNFS